MLNRVQSKFHVNQKCSDRQTDRHSKNITKKLKINEIQSNILMYGEICGKEEIREISNREVIFSDRLLAYAG